ncbi:hypothetical protein AB0M46_48130 [Dactylosporangium sp. NPDC051485]|uniref:hypothetical protein n=1 Tax=Dactylosporangium sp. NPDC051485 TaxID=3154846 RepID=UPI00343D3E25
MSGNRDHSPQDLAAELACTPGAVPVLVTLQDRGGRAPSATLRQACTGGIDDALRWLTAVHLVRPSNADGTLDFDQRDVDYELTTIGTQLTRSLTDLASCLHETAPTDRVHAATGDARQ